MATYSQNSPKFNKRVELQLCRIVPATQDIDIINAVADIRPFIRKLEIYENIFTFGLTGSIEIQDNSSLSTILPLQGVERLLVAFAVIDVDSTGNTISKRQYGTIASPIVLSMFSQTNRIPVTKGAEVYTIHLVSPEIVAMNEYRISKTYKNQFIEDIIADILKKGLKSKKPLVAQKTKTPITMTIPMLTPLQALKLLLLHGQSDNNETNYIFYETLTEFRFESIRKIINEFATKSDSEIPLIIQTLAGTRLGMDTSSLSTADKMELVSGYDFIFAMKKGYFASTTYEVDILNGTYKKAVTSINDPSYRNTTLINGKPKVDAYPLYPYELGGLVNPTAKVFLVPTTGHSAKNLELTQKDPSIHDNLIATTLDGRNRELLSLQLRTIRAVISGASHIKAGDIVRINYPSTLHRDGKIIQDIAASRYLVLGCKHNIINNGTGEFLYETSIEAGTDSIQLKSDLTVG